MVFTEAEAPDVLVGEVGELGDLLPFFVGESGFGEVEADEGGALEGVFGGIFFVGHKAAERVVVAVWGGMEGVIKDFFNLGDDGGYVGVAHAGILLEVGFDMQNIIFL